MFKQIKNIKKKVQLNSEQRKFIRKKNAKQKSICGTQAKKTCVFLNILDNRNENTKPNVVWGMDFTTLKIEKENAPGFNHYLLLIINHFSRRIINNKVFFFAKRKKSYFSTKSN